MALFTIDRTINFEEEKVKKELKIIDSSSNDEEIENKMINQRIVKLQEGTSPHGFFRRRWVTFLKEFGLYDGENISEIGRLYMNDLLSTKEVTLLFLVDRTVNKKGSLVRPLEILLKTSIQLKEQIGNNLITEDDLKYAISKTNNDESIMIATNTIIKSRKNGRGYNKNIEVDQCHFDIWKNLLKTAGINADNNQILIDLDMNIVKYIINYYNVTPAKKYDSSSFDSGFINRIRLPKKSKEDAGILYTKKMYSNKYDETIYKFLFGQKTQLRVLEKNIFEKSQHGDIPFRILNGFNISTSDSSPMNNGIYAAFVGYEGIVINRLRKTNDAVYSFIASHIKSYIDSNFNSDNNAEAIDKFEEFKLFFLEKLNAYKNDAKILKSISDIKEFNREYSIETLENMKLEDYAIGTSSGFSYDIEFGKYKETGCSCSGQNAGKFGIYLSSDGYCDYNNSIIQDYNTYWKNLRKNLVEFLRECSTTEEPLRATKNHQILKGTSLVLAKLLFLYYPSKYVCIASKGSMEKLLKYFEISYSRDMQNEELSFILNKTLREKVSIVNDYNPQYLGTALWDYIYEITEEEKEVKEKMNELIEITDERLEDGYNKIVYGIPGCGKSWYVENKIIANDSSYGKTFRTTFYPDYTNSDFVGQIIPQINNNDKTSVLYSIQCGPFLEALKYAIIHPSENVYLVIEEINRGNAAAIFGDIFQLLDRHVKKSVDDNISNNTSEYYIKNYLISTNLKMEIMSKYDVDYDFENIRIPSNMIIIGTMNTSDQNVFTLDTAFKRRWQMEYIRNDIDKSKYADELLPGTDLKWSKFINVINSYITDPNNGMNINGEDKQIGAYFISGDEWSYMKTESKEEATKYFAEKVLAYIWDDVAKINREDWFDNKKYRTLESIIDGYVSKGLNVFSDNLNFTENEPKNE